ncbi:MAG: response regulator transcription factor [Campylobacterales bacterium]|nr:response regulator transcription factor [Campylobacterales bacterium]
MRALLLEDDFNTSFVIAARLETMGYSVDKCFDGECAMNAVYAKQYDVYILDLMVPNVDGYEVLEYIVSSNPLAATIVISTHIEIEYLKKAFQKGCSDYLKKPFEMEELLLRIRNVVRLTGSKTNTEIINLSQGYSYSLPKNELYYYDELIELTKIESMLLRILILNLGSVVSNEEIKNYVWDDEEISPLTIRYWIYRLIKKFKPGMIVNIRGIGYRLRKLDTGDDTKF